MGGSNRSGVTRRDLFKIGGIAAAGVMGASALSACSPSTGPTGSDGATSAAESTTTAAGHTRSGLPSFLQTPAPITDIAETKDFDVVVVGAGAAGVPAALSAAEAGAKVALIQKEATAISQGNTGSGVDLSKSDPADVQNLVSVLIEEGQHRTKRELLELWAQHGGEAVKWVIEKAAEGGATFYYETPCVQLVQEEDGTVTGAIGKQKDGSYVKLNATKGVVLAAGDYMNNESMVDRNLRDAAMFPLCLVNHTGDGHILGILAGGRMAPLGHARQIHTNYIGPFMFYPFLALDVHGKRFCNETIPMSSLNISMSATYKPEDRGIHFRIFDSKTEGAVEGIPGVPPVALVGEGSAWMDPETVVSGNTLEELCEAAGIPVADGVASIERYNELCAKGCDDDFGVAGSDMAAIDTPPFFCIKGDVGMSGINAGVMVDNRYRVIDTEGAPIPGLYAAGIQAGNPCGGINWSMPGGFSNSHIFTAGRYTVIHALTGDMTPAHPASFEDLADSFVGEDGGYAWDSPLCATAITVW